MRKMTFVVTVVICVLFTACGNFTDNNSLENNPVEYVTGNGEKFVEVIPCLYKMAKDFSGGIALVSDDGERGVYINKSGDVIYESNRFEVHPKS